MLNTNREIFDISHSSCRRGLCFGMGKEGSGGGAERTAMSISQSERLGPVTEWGRIRRFSLDMEDLRPKCPAQVMASDWSKCSRADFWILWTSSSRKRLCLCCVAVENCLCWIFIRHPAFHDAIERSWRSYLAAATPSSSIPREHVA